MICRYVYIVNKDGQMVKATYDLQKGIFQSHTRNGVHCLRKWGWDIQKKAKTKKWHPKTIAYFNKINKLEERK